MPLSDSDRDTLIRTVYGEAGDQSPIGQAAVTHVIMNRQASGRYGSTIPQVVYAPGQFEAWGDRNPQLLRDMKGLKPNDPEYQSIGNVVDAATSGLIPDPTGGMTHFVDEAVQSRRRGGLPDWATGNGLRIGAHTFYAPEGKVSAQSQAMAYADDRQPPPAPSAPVSWDRVLSLTGSNAAPSTVQSPQAAPSSGPSWDRVLSLTGGPAAPAIPAPSIAPLMTPEEVAASHAAAAATMHAPSWLPESVKPAVEEFINRTLRPIMGVPAEAKNELQAMPGQMGEAIGKNITGAAQMASSGIADVAQGFPARGLGKVAFSPVAAVGGVLGGAYQGSVGDVLTKATGNPDFAEKFGMLAPLGGPSRLARAATGAVLPAGITAELPSVSNALTTAASAVAPKATNALQVGAGNLAVSPTERSINEIVRLVGPENVDATAARLAANPNLRVMDVAPLAGARAQGLAADLEQGRANRIIRDAVSTNEGTASDITKQAYSDTLRPPPKVLDEVDRLASQAENVGKQQIAPIVEKAKPADVTDVISYIDSKLGPYNVRAMQNGQPFPRPLTDLQKRLVAVRDQLRGVSPDEDQMFFDVSKPGQQEGGLHWLQSDLRYEASSMIKSGNGHDGNVLMNVRNRMVNAIDDVTGGQYKPALANFRDAKQVQESFEDGWNTYRNKQGLEGYKEDSPEALQRWMETASPEQIKARQLGAVSGAFQKIGSARNAALAGESILRPEYNVDKLKILFGEEKGARMAQLMDDQHAQAVQNAKIVSGSKTAETSAALEGSKLPPVQPMNMLKSGTVPALMTGAAGTLGYLGLPTEALLAAGAGAASTIPAIGTKVGQIASRQLAKSTNIELARRISETGPGRADTIMRMVAHPKVVRARNELQNPP